MFQFLKIFHFFSPSVSSKANESEASPLADAFTGFKQLLLPVIDRNPYLTDGTKQVWLFFFCFKKFVNAYGPNVCRCSEVSNNSVQALRCRSFALSCMQFCSNFF